MKTQLRVDSTIGPLYLVASEQGLHGVFWAEQDVPMGTTDLLRQAALQLGEYLDGRRRDFDLPLAPEGTAFQKRVWGELAKIPYGETRSYRQIAVALAKASACRAVGAANGRNPLSLIVPCHRVISADGTLGGYAGGLDIKRRLLALEQGQSSQVDS